MKSRMLIALAALLCAAGIFVQPSKAQQSSATDTVLESAVTRTLVPDSYFFDGKLAPAQARNSGAIKFSDNHYVIACLVDTAGYASDVQQKFQGIFINEAAITVNGARLPAGFYGFGISGKQFYILDLAAVPVFTTGYTSDASVRHPVPLKITQNGSEFRLYLGRNYLTISR